jgi:hypothetical protein
MGDLERVLYHCNQAIRYYELGNNPFGAGETRLNMAFWLANTGRFNDALLYARAALRDFEPYGQGAAQEIQKTQGLIAWIEEKMRGGG